eukprot:Blabericola_migrator_1__10890@NODE_628_length_7173_cov_74_949901_g459_i0_p8_GENE_NODE_628_length_7173_cov_74_949901_g459_i0NODE_628_length_7173_cov_74_949901_g459_i0_p8_ORF_typecomplete_len150_score32_79DUF1764/PF08576_10/0_57Atg14/PF10186_9/4_9Methyltransf_32/PF13679_6/6_NODE_628_length_7173_cov_74_949901_g459_i026193068
MSNRFLSNVIQHTLACNESRDRSYQGARRRKRKENSLSDLEVKRKERHDERRRERHKERKEKRVRKTIIKPNDGLDIYAEARLESQKQKLQARMESLMTNRQQPTWDNDKYFKAHQAPPPATPVTPTSGCSEDEPEESADCLLTLSRDV